MSVLFDHDQVHKEAVAKLGLDGLSPSYQEEVLNALEKNISERLLVAIHEKLSKKDREEFDAKSALFTKDDACTYLESKIPDFEIFATGIARKVIAEYLDLAAEARSPEYEADEDEEEEKLENF